MKTRKILALLAAALIAPGAAAEKLVIATVNNGDMVRMQTLTDDFTQKNPHIKRKCMMPLRRIELRLPVFVKPSRAKRVCQRSNKRRILAPTCFATQADTINFRRVVNRPGEFINLPPGRLIGHRQTFRRKQIAPIHHHRTFAIKRRGIKFAVFG